MVIAHNLGAMNAQRQYNIVSNRKSKTSEKLSSGYNVNRAADDAAALSISEKMRRQIRGLSQGVENTEDGVSLCQVADGALAEVHDMLQRINELSIQSANGTNSYSDRQAIQEEINELLTEIDRIGDTTSFNDHKIFKASLNDLNNAGINTGKTSAYNFSCTGTPIDSSITKYTFDMDSAGLLINGQSIPWADVKATNGDTLDLLKANTYSATMNGLSFSFAIKDGSTMDSVAESIKEASVDMTANIGTAKESVSGIDIRDTYIEIKVDRSNGTFNITKDEYFALVGNHQLTADDNGITWNGQTISWSDKSLYLSEGYQSIEERILAGKIFHLTFENGPDLQIELNENATIEGVKNALNGATFDINNTNIIGNESNAWTVETNYDYNITQWGFADNFWTDLGYDLGDTFIENTPIESSITIDINDLSNVKASFSNGANTVSFDLDSNSKAKLQGIITNGGMVNAGEELKLNFIYGNSWVNYTITPKQNTSVSDVLNALATKIETEGDIPCAKTYLSATNFKVNDISQGNIGDAPVNYSFNITQPKNTSNTNQSTSNLNLTFDLWIQSGCDSGDGLYLEIDKMNTSILGINGIDVTTELGANDAIKKMDDALEKVSSNRAKIGAQQNRLEHTIANENNIVENTTAAESRIRDADMAELMVQFSKENILAQVGQSMMAQSNQSNQGVLSLLQ